jgi:D-alanyl-D-alanine carboxypeptidase (penicillin-binding protein 5/6)
MQRRLYLFPFLLLAFALVACSDGSPSALQAIEATAEPTAVVAVATEQPPQTPTPPPPATQAPPPTAAPAPTEAPPPAPTPEPPVQAQPAPPPEPIFPAPQPWAAAPSPIRRSGPPAIGAVAAVVVDEASGAVLFDKDAHVSLPPASLTKIATAILALEHGNLDTTVEVDVDSSLMRGSTIMGLRPGDRFSLRDLVYGLMLPSGNDAALAIGRYIAGSDEAFVGRMNELLARLGLRDSHFANPHGLGSRGHTTSAYDLAMLSRYAMTLPGFRDIVNAASWTARGSRTLSFSNINTFLRAYAGADGIKTGYTRSAGPTLAASAVRNGHRLYAVVLNSQSRDSDARALLSWAYANFNWP